MGTPIGPFDPSGGVTTGLSWLLDQVLGYGIVEETKEFVDEMPDELDSRDDVYQSLKGKVGTIKIGIPGVAQFEAKVFQIEAGS